VSAAGPDPRETFPLRRGAPPVVLEAEGFHHPTSARGGGRAFTRYADLTHVAATPRSLWIATRRSVYPLVRPLFVDPAGPERLEAALLARVAQAPEGAARLERMREIDAMAHAPRRPLATWGLVAACLAVFALQLTQGPELFEVGYFSPALFADGDLWRAFTAGLLHGSAVHLAVNLVGLLFFGSLVERVIGTARTVCVMGAAEIGAMGASAATAEGGVVGVSGVLAGLVGALIFLEFRRRDQIPAWWRLPRRLLVMLILLIPLQVLFDLSVPLIAGEAHIGGFFAGMVAAALLMRAERIQAAAGARVRAAAGAALAVLLLSVGAAASALLGHEDFLAHHAARLARLPGISAHELNNYAWMIAIRPRSTREQLEAALLLAERAVAETARRDPTLLDTLAEVQFQLGHPELAVLTIDEAIDQAPLEPYYREQRRRFTGERDPHDRPPDPALPWPGDEGGIPLPPDEEGVTV
jgi:membrane associated rhomboid family serine protease